LKYLKRYEKFSFERDSKIDEGLKEWTAGLILTLATMLGGQSKAQAQQAAPDFTPTRTEVERVKNFLNTNSKDVVVDTLRKINPQDSIYRYYGGNGVSDELSKPELIKTLQTITKEYYNDKGDQIGFEVEETGEYDSGKKFQSNSIDTRYSSVNYETDQRGGDNQTVDFKRKEYGQQIGISNKNPKFGDTHFNKSKSEIKEDIDKIIDWVIANGGQSVTQQDLNTRYTQLNDLINNYNKISNEKINFNDYGDMFLKQLGYSKKLINSIESLN
jgi:hypothetical protein